MRGSKPILRQENAVIINIWPSKDNKHIPGDNVGHVSFQAGNEYVSFWPGPRNDRLDSPKILEILPHEIGRYFKGRPSNFKGSYLVDTIDEAIAEEHVKLINYIAGELNRNDGWIAIIYNKIEENYRVHEGNDEPLLQRDEILVAVKPLEAKVRIALYGLKTSEILKELSSLKKTVVAGWRLIGSSMFSRKLNQKTEENCASMAYRCLSAGGLYGNLSSTTSSDNSSVVSPDNFLQHVFLAKQMELHYFEDTQKFHFDGETSQELLTEAFKNKNGLQFKK